MVDGAPEIVVGVPFEDADLLEGGDIETHLQIGQIEIRFTKKGIKTYEKNTILSFWLS